MRLKLEYERREDGWWLLNNNPKLDVRHETGPYDTKADAQEAKRGIETFVQGHLEDYLL